MDTKGIFLHKAVKSCRGVFGITFLLMLSAVRAILLFQPVKDTIKAESVLTVKGVTLFIMCRSEMRTKTISTKQRIIKKHRVERDIFV